MKCDELKEYYYYEDRVITPATHMYRVYHADKVDAAIEELKDKCQMHDFFWEGCGFAKRGFKNTIAVSEAFDRLEAENAEIKQKLDKAIAERDGNQVCIDALMMKLKDANELIKTARKMLEDAKASHYAEMVDAGMRERRLRRALWLARAERALAERRRYCAMSAFEDIENDALRIKWCTIQRKCRAKAEGYK